MTGLQRYLADLVRGRRPRPFRANPEDLAELRAAIMLRAAAPADAEPSEQFLTELHDRLAAEVTGTPAPTSNRSTDSTPAPPTSNRPEGRIPAPPASSRRADRTSTPPTPSHTTTPPPGHNADHTPTPPTPDHRTDSTPAPPTQNLGVDRAPAASTPSRRRVVRTAGVVAASVAAGVAADRLLTATDPVTAALPPTLAPTDGVWQAVAATRDVPEGRVVPFDLGTVVGFVQRSGDELRAVSGICTHLGCRLALDASNRRLDCPCHRTTFTPDGAVLTHQLPTPPPSLPHLPVREAGGTIEVFAPPRPT